MLPIVKSVPFIALFSGLTLPCFAAIVFFVACAHTALGPYVFGALKLGLFALPFVAAWRWGAKGFRSPLSARRLQIITEGALVGVVMSAALLWIMLVPGIGVMKAAAPQVITTARAFGATDL